MRIRTLDTAGSPLAWSPDSSKIASSHGDDSISIWNIADGMLLRTLSGQTFGDLLYVRAWSPDGCYLASRADDDSVRIFGRAP